MGATTTISRTIHPARRRAASHMMTCKQPAQVGRPRPRTQRRLARRSSRRDHQGDRPLLGWPEAWLHFCFACPFSVPVPFFFGFAFAALCCLFEEARTSSPCLV